MVKADAYGLGMGSVVEALRATPELNGPWAFGVAAVAGLGCACRILLNPSSR